MSKKLAWMVKPKKQRSDEGHKLRDTTLWRKRVRPHQLHLEPYCRRCHEKGILTPGIDVDHIVPISQGGAAYDHANLQTLCKPCHIKKTSQERSHE
jgi:5-methylcytosine-specific restriction enzyme A